MHNPEGHSMLHRYFPILIVLSIFISCFSYSSESLATIREHWISAEKVPWNYAPSGKNLIMPEKGLGIWGHHLIYEKYRYFEYTDKTYTKKIPSPQWMGILGPQLRVIEGDTLKVHFLNKADKPLSMHPHGMQYQKDSEGADMKGPGAYVKPGKSFTYSWKASSSASPGPNDPSSVIWLFHSHVDSVTEIYDGLMGTIIVTRKGMERSQSDPRPRDVDVSLTNLFMIFNENGRKKLGPVNPKVLSEQDEEEANLKHTINGYLFGNLTGLKAKVGQRVRWHLIAMGSEVDIHTAHWHGHTVLESGKRRDVIDLLPTTFKTVDMVTEIAGNWLYHCHVTDHITGGMITRWQVTP